MLRTRAEQFRWLLLATDILVSALVFVAALRLLSPWVTPTTFLAQPGFTLAGVVTAFACPWIFAAMGLYGQRRESAWDLAGRMLLAGGLATLLITVTVFLVALPVPRRFPLICGTAQLGVLALVRLVVFAELRRLRRQGLNYRNVVVLGTGPRADHARATIERHPEWGLRIVGYLDEVDSPIDPHIPLELVHKLVDMPELMKNVVIDEVLIACPRSLLASFPPVVSVCAEAGIPITLLSDLFGDYLPPPQVTSFDAQAAALRFAPVYHEPFQLVVKRVMDCVGSAILLLAAAPVIACAAVLIKATSPGPVFFKQPRCGLNGRLFGFLKLRTMQVGAEGHKAELLHLNEMDGPVFKLEDDPRMTRVGRFLRRWSIDELPQLWQVLRGEMSLVGPRPPLPEEVEQYSTFERRRLSMRPGITCLWQVSGRNQIGFEDWVKLDLQYIDSWSLGLDLEILVRTIPAVLRGSGK